MCLWEISENWPSVTVKYGKIERYAVKDVLAGTGRSINVNSFSFINHVVYFLKALIGSFISTYTKETNWQKEGYGYG